MADQGQERRVHPRLEFTANATLFTADGKIVDASSGNLSAGGALVDSAARVDPGSRVFFDIQLQHARRQLHIRGCALVAHSEALESGEGRVHRSGLQFLDMDSLSRATLDRLLAFNGVGAT